MRGKLFIKCAERGLTDPFKGGNVKLKTFMDLLKHACKVIFFFNLSWRTDCDTSEVKLYSPNENMVSLHFSNMQTKFYKVEIYLERHILQTESETAK